MSKLNWGKDVFLGLLRPTSKPTEAAVDMWVIVCLFVYVPTGVHLGGKRDAIKAHTDQTHTHTHTLSLEAKGRKFALSRKLRFPLSLRAKHTHSAAR